MTEHHALRKTLGLTAASEARLLGVDPRTVQRWDAGDRDVPPPVWRLLRLIESERKHGRIAIMETLMAMVS